MRPDRGTAPEGCISRTWKRSSFVVLYDPHDSIKAKPSSLQLSTSMRSNGIRIPSRFGDRIAFAGTKWQTDSLCRVKSRVFWSSPCSSLCQLWGLWTCGTSAGVLGAEQRFLRLATAKAQSHRRPALTECRWWCGVCGATPCAWPWLKPHRNRPVAINQYLYVC